MGQFATSVQCKQMSYQDEDVFVLFNYSCLRGFRFQRLDADYGEMMCILDMTRHRCFIVVI